MIKYMPDVLVWPVFIITNCFIQFVQDFKSFNNFSKYSMNTIQIVQIISKGDEKLLENK